MASSEEALRAPATCRPSRSMMTRSSGVSIPLFMHVGVVRTRSSSSRTERLPSHATIYPRSYNQRPATQMSARCCCWLFAEPGKRESVDMVRLLTGAELSSEPSGETSAYCDFARRERVLQLHRGLGINSTQFQRARNAVNGQHIGRDAVIYLVELGVAYHLIEGIFHHIQQALVHFAFAPEKALAILHPLKVAYGHAARVAQNVRDREYSFTVDNRVGLPGRRPIRAFTQNARLHLGGVFLRDLILDRRGNGNLAGLEEHVPRGHLCAASGKILQGLLLRVHPVDDLGDVESFFVV